MNVVLGVTGSISAYKAVDIMRAFLKNGHDVSVVMTEAALKFIPALPFDTFTPGKVYCDMWEVRQDPLIHINLGKDNDLLLIAPASANTIGKIANGIADDLLSATFLAFNKQVVIAPAMNTNMYEHPAVKENIARLITRGVSVIEPEVGELACRVEGKGKLPSPETIYEHCIKLGAVKG